MMPPFKIVFPTNRIAYFVEVSLLFYLAQQVKFVYQKGIMRKAKENCLIGENDNVKY